MSVKIFISYSRHNEKFVKSIHKTIITLGYEVWFDRELKGGQVWWNRILEEIRECDIFIFVLDTRTLDSFPCKEECRYAKELLKPIVPINIEENLSMNIVPSYLSSIQWILYQEQDSEEKKFQKLSPAFLNALSSRQSLPSPLPSPPTAPLSKLGKLSEQVKQEEELSGKEQTLLISDLEHSLKNLKLKDDVYLLLKIFRNRRDIHFINRQKIDILLSYEDLGNEKSKVKKTVNNETKTLKNINGYKSNGYEKASNWNLEETLKTNEPIEEDIDIFNDINYSVFPIPLIFLAGLVGTLSKINNSLLALFMIPICIYLIYFSRKILDTFVLFQIKIFLICCSYLLGYLIIAPIIEGKTFIWSDLWEEVTGIAIFLWLSSSFIALFVSSESKLKAI